MMPTNSLEKLSTFVEVFLGIIITTGIFETFVIESSKEILTLLSGFDHMTTCAPSH